MSKKCKHCQDTIRPDAACEMCGKLTDQCPACHAELAHDQIKMQNTNTLGGRKYIGGSGGGGHGGRRSGCRTQQIRRKGL